MTIDELQRRTDVPVISTDHHGYITAINGQFREAYGWKSSDLVGKPLATIIPEQYRDAHHLGFSRFLLTGNSTILGQPLNLLIVTNDGRELEAEHYVVAEKRDGAWSFAATIRRPG